jgi:phosphatidylserine/phosphatidylglycerophosphate/cardiolipin synthase-like enzyme
VSFDTERETIVKAIYEVYGRNPDIEMRFLKQVPHSSLADKRRAAIAETLFQYVMGAQQRFNRLVHEKFILVDNTLILTTANYTSTQFAFALRRMEMKFENGKLRKDDYFSEVNGFIILPDCGDEVLRQYEEHFNELWDEGTDIQINL